MLAQGQRRDGKRRKQVALLLVVNLEEARSEKSLQNAMPRSFWIWVLARWLWLRVPVAALRLFRALLSLVCSMLSPRIVGEMGSYPPLDALTLGNLHLQIVDFVCFTLPHSPITCCCIFQAPCTPTRAGRRVRQTIADLNDLWLIQMMPILQRFEF